MNIVTRVSEWRDVKKRLAGKSIGFVPTMGHLHEGHMSLYRLSKEQNDITVASIFVNQTQFNQASDFDNYPRTLEQDKAMLESEGVDYLFLPNADEIYADDYQVQVNETALSTELEGEFRPGHFKGVLTVVMKLFNIIQPARAYLGEKDYQQFLLIKKMAEALFMPVAVIPCMTVRAEDGVALSSRNSRLTVEQRQRATDFAQLLASSLSPDVITSKLQELGFKVEYIAEKWGRRLGAVWLDDVRLIDNVAL